jgi:hypothetical protein
MSGSRVNEGFFDPPATMTIQTTFFTAATKNYELFVLPYITSVLAHNADACVEICLEDPEAYSRNHGAALEHLNEHFPLRWHLRAANFAQIIPNSVRFIETPERMSEFTYIGDIDILVMEGNITATHLAKMRETRLPYDNIVRKGTKRLSGLHFTKSVAYYPISNNHGADFSTESDETLLYKLVSARGHRLPELNYDYHPTHGFHFSLNRKPTNDAGVSWRLLELWLDDYKNLRASSAWRSLHPHFDPRYKYLLTLLEVALEAQYPGNSIVQDASIKRWLDELFQQ